MYCLSHWVDCFTNNYQGINKLSRFNLTYLKKTGKYLQNFFIKYLPA
jgi:hypothetical protein